MSEARVCRILSLDGGGAKGFYTLGVLREVEAMVGQPLHEKFDLIFGTSTGSIIAALLATGRGVDEIHEKYKEYVPSIMRKWWPSSKSAALAAVGEQVFGDDKFEAAKTGLGIVTTKWVTEQPMVFKNRPKQAHGQKATFNPGFGCMIRTAVEASCSAFPFFERKTVVTQSGDEFELVDGGYCANNPALYAIGDALSAYGHAPTNCRVLSIGVGRYPEKFKITDWAMRQTLPVSLLQKTLEVNAASMEVLRWVLFRQIPTVRVHETFDYPELATDMFEHDLKKLNLLRQRGKDSFGKFEDQISDLLK